jgi:GNAT superfamily N-acetyltransferase
MSVQEQSGTEARDGGGGGDKGDGDTRSRIAVRRLRPTDSIGELTTLLHRAYAKQTAMGLHALASHQTAEVTRKRVSKGECFVAELDGKLVGTIMFQEPSWGGAPESGPRWFHRPDVCNFSQFAVEPKLQGRGIGLILLDRVEQRARELGMGELALSTAEPDTELVEFYRRRGFREVEHFDWGVTNYTSIIMSKALARS